MDSRALLSELKAGTLDRDGVEGAAARAILEFADWLAFPTELGKYPDTIEVLDARELYWPPAGENLPLTLLQYRVCDESGFEPDTVGVGLVGSVTFSLFSYENHQRPPEDAYAIHCAWECLAEKLISESSRCSPKEWEHAIAASAVPLLNPTSVSKLTFAKQIDFPGDEVFLVAGERDTGPGWVVCDGPRSTWYSASELPEDAPAKTVAMLHVGRVLLGFETRSIARANFKTPAFSLSDGDFTERYERALLRARNASESEREELYDSFGPLGRHASRYVRLLTRAGRSEETQRFLAELVPYWDHNSGYSELGTLAYEAGHFDTARHFIEKLRGSYPDHHRSETMGLLARIYAKDGKRLEGIALLRACIDKIKADRQCSPREAAAFSEPLLVALAELEH